MFVRLVSRYSACLFACTDCLLGCPATIPDRRAFCVPPSLPIFHPKHSPKALKITLGIQKLTAILYIYQQLGHLLEGGLISKSLSMLNLDTVRSTLGVVVKGTALAVRGSALSERDRDLRSLWLSGSSRPRILFPRRTGTTRSRRERCRCGGGGAVCGNSIAVDVPSSVPAV
jgi:hypothetical protein